MELQQTVYTIQLDPGSLSLTRNLADARTARLAPFESLEEYLRSANPREPGCIVLGAPPAGTEPLAALEQLAQQDVGLPMIVVLDRPTVPLAVRAMQLGATSVLETPLDRVATQQALEHALLVEALRRAERQQREDVRARLATLTDGEREVLNRLMTGMANKNIAADLQLGLRTVELRRAKILKKLGAKSLAEMVRFVVLAESSNHDMR
jgi:FixJ family two-component response regulator